MPDTPLKQLLQSGARADRIRSLALGEGMRTLRQDGIEKIVQGHTDLNEVHRVCSR